jgi:hypothetical protein
LKSNSSGYQKLSYLPYCRMQAWKEFNKGKGWK